MRNALSCIVRVAAVSIATSLIGGFTLEKTYVQAAVPNAGSSLRIEYTPTRPLFDEPITVVIKGAKPGARVTVSTEMRDEWGQSWSSAGAFLADHDGTVDLSKTKPLEGAYEGIDAMGLFWSMAVRGPSPEQPALPVLLQTTTGLKPLMVQVKAVAESASAETTVERRLLGDDIRRQDYRKEQHGIDGALFLPAAQPRYAVLVISGSGGGLAHAVQTAALLASHGAAALAVCYFDHQGSCGLRNELVEIPMEYFGTALDLLAKSVPSGTSLGVFGMSKGAEAALLLGAMRSDIRTIVAATPSAYVWQGVRFGDKPPLSSWTLDGKPLAYLKFPEGTQFSYDLASIPDLRALHERASQHVPPEVLIPIERISASVVLAAGTADGTWNAAPMSRRMMQEHGTKAGWTYLEFENAGHAIYFPYVPPIAPYPLPDGTPRANSDASLVVWSRLLHLLNLT